jgi:glycosyltransferase involved in cell wall biosynthesis
MMPGVPAADRLTLAFIADPNSIHTRHWITYFAEQGHVVHLLDAFGADIAPGLDSRIQVERYVAHPPPRLPLISMFRGRSALRSLLRRLQPDVLHALFVRRYGWQAALSGFHPLVVTPWGSDLLLTSIQTRRTRAWDRRALRNADLVTFLSGALRDAAVASGARPDRLVGIQEGVDTARFSPGAADPALAERLGLAGRRLVFSPRAVRPLYRQELIVAAFATLPPDTVLLLSARDADPAYLADVRAAAEQRGFGHRLLVVDNLDETEMVGVLRLASVVVSVPRSDGRPISVMEAMACGTPVIAGDLPPLRELLGSIAPELLADVESGGPDAVGEALNRALQLDADGRVALGEALRAEVVRTSDHRTNMARMEVLYRQLAGEQVRAG